MRNRITQLSRFLLLCAVMFLVTMIPQSVKAITVEEAGKVYMTDSQAGGGKPLYGRLNINYTGNTNYDTWSNDIVTNYNTYDSKADQYKAAETVLKKADNSVIGKKIKNNRSAKLTKSSGGDGTVRAAYLVWQARTSVDRSTTDAAALAKSEIAFVLPDGSAKLIKAQYATYDNRSIDYKNQNKEEGVRQQYTFVNMYADVTDIINKSSKIYGTYSVFNIPYYEHIGGGEGAGGWQLIIVENCDMSVPMRAVRLRMSADFNIDDVSKHDGEWVEKDIKTGMVTKVKSKAYKANDKEPLTGQYLTIFVYSGNTAVNLTKLNLYAQKETEKFNKNKRIFGLSKEVSPYLSINGEALYDEVTTTRGDLVDFTIPKESTQPAYANDKYTLQTNTGDETHWVTMFVTGIAVDISDNFAEGAQVTTVKSPTTVTVSQKITNKTLQSKTGYYNGKLVVTLDEALTPTNTKPKLTVYNKEADKTTTITGDWDAKKHTITFYVDKQGDRGTKYADSKFKNPSRGSYISYSIDCTYEKNSGVDEFKNGSKLSGDLRSQNVATKTTIDDILSEESTGIPIYVLTVKIDKTTVNKAVTQVFNNGTAITGAGGTVNSSSTVSSGDYYMASYELPCNANIVSTPTFNTGCVFSMWTDLNEKTGVSTNCKVTSDYVNDKTYAYERSMPAYNMTLTLTGVLDEAVYTVHHWKQKTTGIASDHDDKNYELAETETKKAQIGSKVTPAVKTYTGFDSPKTQTKAVTADGKMVIDYYYERHLYNVTLNAGTGIEKTTGGGSYRYGQSVTIDAAVKEGYHWLNWKGNYKGGSGGEQTVDAKKFVFTMPAGNVTMTANAEANKYTIHFDPNGGAGHIDDIEATYDTDVTLPDVCNADGTAAYVKYTLDGQNVTEDVIAGVIPKAMMDGYEEEETEIEDTETKDDENSDIEDEDTGKDGNDADIVETDAPDDMDETEATETEDDSDDANDAELDEIEEDKKAEAPRKKVYASIFMGWALEDGKDTFIPKWKAGDIVQNLVAEDGGEITLYAVWDDCPWIQAQDLYYTLEQAQSGFITEEEILSHATATDREDGSPILPGTNPAPSDPEVFTSFTIPDYQESEFTNLQHDFATSENLTVVDHTGNTYVKQIMVYVVDTTPVVEKPEGKTRFISEKYFKLDHDHGGLEENSIWMTDPDYYFALQKAFDNLKNDTPEDEFLIPHETILEMKQYVQEHGSGNSKEPGALTEFYNRFMAPNKVE
ncbi:MAG: InlB B-repeat-containing protein [Roseburia intestinalis]